MGVEPRKKQRQRWALALAEKQPSAPCSRQSLINTTGMPSGRRRNGRAHLLGDSWFTPALEAALQQVFTQFDADRDGLLSMAELQAYSRAVNKGQELAADEIEQVHDYFETQDGMLTQGGFLQMYYMQTDSRPEDTLQDLERLGYSRQTLQRTEPQPEPEPEPEPELEPEPPSAEEAEAAERKRLKNARKKQKQKAKKAAVAAGGDGEALQIAQQIVQGAATAATAAAATTDTTPDSQPADTNGEGEGEGEGVEDAAAAKKREANRKKRERKKSKRGAAEAAATNASEAAADGHSTAPTEAAENGEDSGVVVTTASGKTLRLGGPPAQSGA
jgi:hypothetical protein